MVADRRSKSGTWTPTTAAEIHALYLPALRLARRILHCQADAEDAVQLAFEQFYSRRQINSPIDNPRAWLLTCVKNFSISLLRKNRRYQLDDISYRELSISTNLASQRDIIICTSEYIRGHKINMVALKYIIAKAVLFGASANQNHTISEAVSRAVSGYSQRHLGRLVNETLHTLKTAQRNTGEALIDEEGIQGINIHLLCAALTNLEALAQDQFMTDLMGDICAAFVSEVQQSARICRIDLILRSGTERHLLYENKLHHYSRYLDLLYTAAKLPRSCMILGALSYLHKVSNKPLFAYSILDPSYIENFFLGVIHEKSTGYIDRWLAIIAIGLHFERLKCDQEYSTRILSCIESVAIENPMQRVGLAFAWLDSNENDKDSIIADKVLQLVRPDREADLSLLPITIMGTFLGGDMRISVQGVKMQLLWDVTLRALGSRSPVALLGALRHIFHIGFIDRNIMESIPQSEISKELTRIRIENSSSLIRNCLDDLSVPFKE